MVKQKIILGTLIMIILTASIYIMMPDNVKIVVENTVTEYYTWDDGWNLGAKEYVNLFDGTTKMRAKSREVTTYDENGLTIIERKSLWKDNITTISKYIFNGNVTDVELVPIETKHICINCEGKILHFEYRDITYGGETQIINSPFSFGRRMKVEWEDSAYYSKVFQQLSSDKIIIRYKPETSYEEYDVRMFDPVVSYGWTLDNTIAPAIAYYENHRTCTASDFYGHNKIMLEASSASATRTDLNNLTAYQWNGSSYVENATLLNSMASLKWASCGFVYNLFNDNNWSLIVIGDETSEFTYSAYQYDGSSWAVNATAISGINTSVNGPWFKITSFTNISGNDEIDLIISQQDSGDDKSYYWNSITKTWVADTSIVVGLPTSSNTYIDVINNPFNGTDYLALVGGYIDSANGYLWNGTSWNYDATYSTSFEQAGSQTKIMPDMALDYDGNLGVLLGQEGSGKIEGHVLIGSEIIITQTPTTAVGNITFSENVSCSHTIATGVVFNNYSWYNSSDNITFILIDSLTTQNISSNETASSTYLKCGVNYTFESTDYLLNSTTTTLILPWDTNTFTITESPIDTATDQRELIYLNLTVSNEQGRDMNVSIYKCADFGCTATNFYPVTNGSTVSTTWDDRIINTTYSWSYIVSDTIYNDSESNITFTTAEVFGGVVVSITPTVAVLNATRVDYINCTYTNVNPITVQNYTWYESVNLVTYTEISGEIGSQILTNASTVGSFITCGLNYDYYGSNDSTNTSGTSYYSYIAVRQYNNVTITLVSPDAGATGKLNWVNLSVYVLDEEGRDLTVIYYPCENTYSCSPIETTTGVTSGSNTSYLWTDREADTTYHYTILVSDGLWSNYLLDYNFTTVSEYNSSISFCWDNYGLTKSNISYTPNWSSTDTVYNFTTGALTATGAYPIYYNFSNNGISSISQPNSGCLWNITSNYYINTTISTNISAHYITTNDDGAGTAVNVTYIDGEIGLE